jgi:hypothetical protein
MMIRTKTLGLTLFLGFTTSATAVRLETVSLPGMVEPIAESIISVTPGPDLDSVFRLALIESDLMAQAEQETASAAMDQDSAGLGPGKSPKKAGLLSLIYPGAGQIYAGAKTRGWIMVGLETTFWISYLYHNGVAKDKESDYQAYADEHYERSRYQDFLDEDVLLFHPEGTPDGDFLRNNFFLLPEEKNQQYYEDIGKYDKYVMGWSEWWNWYIIQRDDTYDWLYWNNWDSSDGVPFPEDETTLGTIRGQIDIYKDMRVESNKMFSRAKLMVGLALFHRVFGVIDAIRTARLTRGETMTSNRGFTGRMVLRAGQPTVMLGWKGSF